MNNTEKINFINWMKNPVRGDMFRGEIRLIIMMDICLVFYNE